MSRDNPVREERRGSTLVRQFNNSLKLDTQQFIDDVKSHKIDVNAKIQGSSYLHRVIKVQVTKAFTAEIKLEVVRALIAARADVDSMNIRKEEPIHCAAKVGDIEIIHELLKHTELKEKYECEMHPLHTAIISNQIEGVKVFIEQYDVSPDIPCGLHSYPLHAAVYARNPRIIKFLVEKGATIEKRDLKDRTPLDLAAVIQDIDTVDALIECGAKTNRVGKSGWTPLHSYISVVSHSLRPTNIDFVKKLVGDNLNIITMQDKNGNTPLHCISGTEENKSIELWKSFIDLGFSLTIPNLQGQTMLHKISSWYPFFLQSTVAYIACYEYQKKGATTIGEAQIMKLANDATTEEGRINFVNECISYLSPGRFTKAALREPIETSHDLIDGDDDVLANPPLIISNDNFNTNSEYVPQIEEATTTTSAYDVSSDVPTYPALLFDSLEETGLLGGDDDGT